MTKWTDDELAGIAAAEELRIAPQRRDGTPRRPVTIWVVRQGDDLYVRSYRGPEGSWFRSARASGQGHIEAGGVDKDVNFVEETDLAINGAIDDAYRTKYRRYLDSYVPPMLAEGARATTLRLQPR
ncbi:DUF2255 family protein [Marinactinospora rubrisoli]|uniref:DUF2255 family protein n=1 Tax=Marinactinospora rubrisoli TaxID=2715399 RepID=A0ABW2KIQ5_9ACTN